MKVTKKIVLKMDEVFYISKMVVAIMETGKWTKWMARELYIFKMGK